MNITFLGTGTSTGIPVVGCSCSVCQSKDPKDKRLRSSVMVEHKGKKILIDCGPDFRQQFLRQPFEQIDAVLLTHSHRDHIAGLDDMKSLHFKDHSNSQIYCTEAVLKELKQVFFYVFSNKQYPGVPSWDIHLINDYPFTIGDITITPIALHHGQLPVMGFRIGKFAYLTDLNAIPESEFDKLKKLDILVLDALRLQTHHSHLSLAEATELAHRIGARKTYFTHICHHMPDHKTTNRQLPPTVELAYDGLQIFL